MTAIDQLQSALFQTLAVLALGVIVFAIYRFKLRGESHRETVWQFLGLQPFSRQLDRRYALILFAFAIFSMVSTWWQFNDPILQRIINNDSSPYSKILRNGMHPLAFIAGVLYCFVQAAFSEELLFRGIIGKRLYTRFGYNIGNVLQALLFCAMHLAIFKLVTGEWFSRIQAFAFFTSFSLGLTAGYLNFRNDGESIGPSWLLHGLINFVAFLTLAGLLTLKPLG